MWNNGNFPSFSNLPSDLARNSVKLSYSILFGVFVGRFLISVMLCLPYYLIIIFIKLCVILSINKYVNEASDKTD